MRATIASYLKLLERFHRGESFVKVDEMRRLQRLLDDRTIKAIEKKYQNISAVLVGMGLDYLDGYVPLFNYQRRLLPDLVRGELDAHASLVALLTREAEDDSTLPSERITARLELVEPPKSDARSPRQPTPEHIVSPLNETTLAERQERNARLGRAGEEVVVEYERKRLHDAGRRDLAERVEHVAVTRGDGLGFDVSSFELQGKPTLIEVKTTRWGALTRFFVTRNELLVSREQDASYRLYRLFRFESAPRMFVLPGALDRSCELEPVQYSARLS